MSTVWWANIASAACLLAFSGTASACGQDGALPVPLDQVSLQKVTFTPSGDGRKLLVFGILKNGSPHRLRNVMLELRFFNEKHVLVDTFTRCVDNVIAPPAGEVGWRIRENIYDFMTPYVAQEVRIVSAEAIKPVKPGEPEMNPFLRDMLVSWVPLLVLLGFLVYLLKKLVGKQSSSYKAVLLMEEHMGCFDKNSRLLERLVLATEARARGIVLPPGDDARPPG
ncbi:hypothetical protein [Massilia rubra]|uniref:Uncharacterized protein n=1 Tax=Massilia rubra TaxID=2607910 RepID=A0ABX0LSH2_9BURK|nr:hypothetical protein [Massilia rubra]NHZ33081.1 hypothetical protein [Massilia rubra]